MHNAVVRCTWTVPLLGYLLVSVFVCCTIHTVERRTTCLNIDCIHFLAFIYTARARMAQWVRLDYLTTHINLLPIRRGFAPDFVNYKKVHSTRSASDNFYQLLAHGRWFFPGTPASSTSKTGHHDTAEILLKVALNTINQIMFTALYCSSIKKL